MFLCCLCSCLFSKGAKSTGSSTILNLDVGKTNFQIKKTHERSEQFEVYVNFSEVYQNGSNKKQLLPFAALKERESSSLRHSKAQNLDPSAEAIGAILFSKYGSRQKPIYLLTAHLPI